MYTFVRQYKSQIESRAISQKPFNLSFRPNPYFLPEFSPYIIFYRYGTFLRRNKTGNKMIRRKNSHLPFDRQDTLARRIINSIMKAGGSSRPRRIIHFAFFIAPAPSYHREESTLVSRGNSSIGSGRSWGNGTSVFVQNINNDVANPSNNRRMRHKSGRFAESAKYFIRASWIVH